MPRVEKVHDRQESFPPLRVTRRKEYRLSSRRTISPRIKIKCGCCDKSVEIYHENKTDNPHRDTLEINGVLASVDQWRQVLLPLLSNKYKIRKAKKKR